MLRYKNTTLTVKDVDYEKGRVRLYASAFGNVDSDGDVLVKGAYAKTIKEWGPEGKNRIKHLWQHNAMVPIGRPMKMEEDNQGLLVDSYITDTKNGDYRKLYREGIISEHSVGFEAMGDKMEYSEDVTYIKEVKLWEYSAVTWGANENTPVVDVKSMSKEEQTNALSERVIKLSSFLRHSDATDETLQAIELELKAIEATLGKMGEPVVKTTQPLLKSGDLSNWFSLTDNF